MSNENIEKTKIIFYSWQSDLPNSTNRGFIQKALEGAAKQIHTDQSISIEPVIDRDTTGIPGSPDIAGTILKKIDKCDIFTCDISIINNGSEHRLTPNPNVLFELGYALQRLGWDRILLILNTEFGAVETLPFDLRMKRVLTYSEKKNNQNRSIERNKLQSKLLSALKDIFRQVTLSQSHNSGVELLNTFSLSDDILSVYKNVLDLARREDFVSWRRIRKQAILQISNGLNSWRKKYENDVPVNIENLHRIALEGANNYTSLFSIALAGIESGIDKFSNQTDLVEEVLEPRNWKPNGNTKIVYFPNAAACIYQALNGAMCLQANQLSLAVKLARTKIVRKFEDKSFPLYQRLEIVGWPETLGKKSTDIWDFLMKLPNEWNWLNGPFNTVEDYQESLCAYYLVLNIIEFVDMFAEGKEEILQQDEIKLDIPLCFMHENTDILRRAYRLLLSDPIQVRDIWGAKNIPEDKIKKLWPRWIYHLKHWLDRTSNFGFRIIIIHENLFEDINV